jgi:hypothetical protein
MRRHRSRGKTQPGHAETPTRRIFGTVAESAGTRHGLGPYCRDLSRTKLTGLQLPHAPSSFHSLTHRLGFCRKSKGGAREMSCRSRSGTPRRDSKTPPASQAFCLFPRHRQLHRILFAQRLSKSDFQGQTSRPTTKTKLNNQQSHNRILERSRPNLLLNRVCQKPNAALIQARKKYTSGRLHAAQPMRLFAYGDPT